MTRYAFAVAIALAIALSCAGPDRFGVGANATQRDWMRADPNTLLANDTGFGYGVGVWLEWDLRKQQLPVAFDWPDRPPFYLAAKDQAPTIVTTPPAKEPDKPDRVDQAIGAARELDGMSASTQIIILVLGLAAVFGIITVAYLRQSRRKPKP